MNPDDLETRAALHHVMRQAAALHRALTALSPGAAAREGFSSVEEPP